MLEKCHVDRDDHRALFGVMVLTRNLAAKDSAKDS
jgi:hypothetical protein